MSASCHRICIHPVGRVHGISARSSHVAFKQDDRQDGEFDPNAGKEVVKPDVKMTNPITGPLEAYGPLVQQVAALGIDHAVNLFYATEGRYPNSYDEFMTRIIKEKQHPLASDASRT